MAPISQEHVPQRSVVTSGSILICMSLLPLGWAQQCFLSLGARQSGGQISTKSLPRGVLQKIPILWQNAVNLCSATTTGSPWGTEWPTGSTLRGIHVILLSRTRRYALSGMISLDDPLFAALRQTQLCSGGRTPYVGTHGRATSADENLDSGG